MKRRERVGWVGSLPTGWTLALLVKSSDTDGVLRDVPAVVPARPGYFKLAAGAFPCGFFSFLLVHEEL
ncbi:hypothetical protein HPB47_028513 [Ixodes persulcatus]|uniref:Uncharacterized protein n=1 Tax=Ixodes persulcatus TaxID=34615 RepID=A0AC60PT67_IXOPE|nr:hypothetical protein HPB47_028513 [Ixodes persulcatus]